MLRLSGFVFLLHAYVGWRLLSDMAPGSPGIVATGLWLAASTIAIPLGLVARNLRQPLKDRLTWASVLAIGSFSSLFVLTFLRDAAILGSALIGALSVETVLRSEGALAVPILAALATIVGFVNAR